jgi:hypothetical protein
MIVDLIEHIPVHERNLLIKSILDELAKDFQQIFNVLSISYLTASADNPELIASHAETVRESLEWLDKNLTDIDELKEHIVRRNLR